MPRQGQSVESCVITQWMKNKGDEVREGEVLFSYETDKSAFEEEAKVSGTLLEILAGEGDDVPCTEGVCIIGAPGEDYSALIGGKAPAAGTEAEAATAPEAEKAAPAPAPAVQPKADGRIAVSPRARAAAARLGVDVAMATPTGAEGRVIERDIIAASRTATRAVGASAIPGTGLGGRATTADVAAPAPAEAPAAAPAAQAAPQAAAYTDKPLSGVRKAVAKAMMTSLQTTAQLTHTVSFDATEIFALRAKFKASQDADVAGITIGDMVLFAVSRVLPAYEALNANLLENNVLRTFADVNLGVAVDTPRGLLVPTVFAADKLSLVGISKAVKALGASAKAGNIAPDMLRGGSFTVSNLGGFGVEHFTPVLNAPQTGILGVCAAVNAVRPGKDGGIELYKSIPLCLTYDHRALDGAPATRFLVDLKKALENFTALLVK